MIKQQEQVSRKEYDVETQAKALQPTTNPHENQIEDNLPEEKASCNDDHDISDETMIREVQACSALVKEFVAFAQDSRERRRKYKLENEVKDVQINKLSPKPASFFEKVTGYLANIFHGKSQDNSQDVASSQHLSLGEQAKEKEKIEILNQKVSSHKTVQFFDKKSK